ncbi:MAG: hypothetical protein MJD61_08980 [Proteobacteria bacterium]|nr:hypothetical protein [Pseudomonadota bacterium]
MSKTRAQRYGLAGALCGSLAVALTLGLALPEAASQDRSIAGSVQVGYLHVLDERRARSERQIFDGPIGEVTLKMSVDFSEQIAAQIKLCYGCHGFEVDMGYIDVYVADELNLRIGRFNPAFGDFPLRHDPANHKTIDKPLPYAMGKMLYREDYGLGILPSPYVDTGIEVNGTHWFGNKLELDYAVYLVGGLRGSAGGINYKESRSGAAYYVDNNSQPALGGRFTATLDFSLDFTTTLGVSGMRGTYDPLNHNRYTIVGTDLYARMGRFDLRVEYLIRRMDISLGTDPASQFKFGPKNDRWAEYEIRDGFYSELTYELSPEIELLARVDGLRRFGNAPKGSPLSARSSVYRITPALNYRIGFSARIKVQGEYYQFSDYENEVVLGASLAAVF